MPYSNKSGVRVQTRYVLAAFAVSVPLSVYLLRQNNIEMLRLRDEVLLIDEQTGDINQVAPKLEELGNYILNHMNTNLGNPVDLPGTFNTAVEEAQEKAQASGAVNTAVYTRAQKTCEDPFIPLTARAQCVQDYVVANAPAGTDAVDLELPNKSLFSYTFASPYWSPDAAGLMLLFSFLSFVTLVVVFIANQIAPFLGAIIARDPLE